MNLTQEPTSGNKTLDLQVLDPLGPGVQKS